MNDLTAPIEDLAHERAIRTCLLRYCRGLDRQDWDLVRSAYHVDAVVDYGSYRGDVDGLVAWARAAQAHVPQALHVIADGLIERDGATAIAETPYTVFQRIDAADSETQRLYTGGTAERRPLDVTLVGRYLDRLELRDGAWRIAHRTTVVETWRAGFATADVPSDWVTAHRDGRDPLWQVRRAAGLDQAVSA